MAYLCCVFRFSKSTLMTHRLNLLQIFDRTLLKFLDALYVYSFWFTKSLYSFFVLLKHFDIDFLGFSDSLLCFFYLIDVFVIVFDDV